MERTGAEANRPPFCRFCIFKCNFLNKNGILFEISLIFVLNGLKDYARAFNSLRPRQNRRHFADDIFNVFWGNENVWIPIKISLKCVPKSPINNIPAMVQMMAWRRPGDKPLSEPMLVSSATHLCVTRPQWVNSGDAIVRSTSEKI